MNQGYCREFVKHNSNKHATNRNMHFRKQRESPKCPRCNAPEEDGTHVLQCTGSNATLQWQASIKKVQEWLEEQQTDQDVCHVILSRLNSWHNATDSSDFNLLPITMQNRLKQQEPSQVAGLKDGHSIRRNNIGSLE